MITSKRIKNYLRTKDTNTFIDSKNQFKPIPELTIKLTKLVIKWNQKKISNEDTHKIKLRVRRVLVQYCLVKMVVPSRYKYKSPRLPKMKFMGTSTARFSHRGMSKSMAQARYLQTLVAPEISMDLEKYINSQMVGNVSMHTGAPPGLRPIMEYDDLMKHQLNVVKP